MTISELKEYIYNEQKIKYILEEIGCHDVKYNSQKEYYSAAQPDGDNPQGVNIRNNEYLNYRSFSRGIDYEDNQDLINLEENIYLNLLDNTIESSIITIENPFDSSKFIDSNV